MFIHNANNVSKNTTKRFFHKLYLSDMLFIYSQYKFSLPETFPTFKKRLLSILRINYITAVFSNNFTEVI